MSLISWNGRKTPTLPYGEDTGLIDGAMHESRENIYSSWEVENSISSIVALEDDVEPGLGPEEVATEVSSS